MTTVLSPATEAMIAALTEQRRLYTELESLARKQSDYVATGESEELMTILAARNRLIDQLSVQDRKLQPYKGKWQETLDAMPAEPRGVVAGLLQDVQRLLAEILERDEADKQSLIRQKQEVSVQLNRAAMGKQVHKAYAAMKRA